MNGGCKCSNGDHFLAAFAKKAPFFSSWSVF